MPKHMTIFKSPE